MKFNKKFTTIAVYALIVILVSLLFAYLIFSSNKDSRLAGFGATIGRLLTKVIIGAVIAFILNPVVGLFENLVFTSRSVRQEVSKERRALRQKGKHPTVSEMVALSAEKAQAEREARRAKKIAEMENAVEPKNPVKRFFFKRRKAPSAKPLRLPALICAYIIFFALVALFLWALVPQLISTITDFISRLRSIGTAIPASLTRFLYSDLMRPVTEFLSDYIDIQEVVAQIRVYLINQLSGIVATFTSMISGLYNILYNILLGVILSIYFLHSKELLKRQFTTFVNSFFKEKGRFWIKFIYNDLNTVFGQFLQGKIVDSLIIFLLCLIVFSIFRFPYAPMLAMIVGVTNIIPFFGPIVGGIFTAPIVLITTPRLFIPYVIAVIVIQQIDGNLIGPFILGDSMDMPNVWVILSIIIMGGLFGFPGMFFGVPIFAVFMNFMKELARQVREKRAAVRQPAPPEPEKQEKADKPPQD